MPNPFPGMNPYLENPHNWRDVHHALIYCFRAALNTTLPPAFAARIEERVYVQGTAKDYVADALVVETFAPPTVGSGGAATLVRPQQDKLFMTTDKPCTVTFGGVAEYEPFIEVRTGLDWDEIVLVVEFLSPTNKTMGTGYDEYKRKQRDLINSNTHLLEIDLLRDGASVFAPSQRELQQRLGHYDYLISLHHAFAGAKFDLWPLVLRDRLPRLLLPLTGEDRVVVDVQAVLDQAYRESDYDRILNYSRPPVPPLRPDDAKWASELIAKMNGANAAANQTNEDGTTETKEF